MVGEILSNFRSIFFLAEEIPSQQILKNRKIFHQERIGRIRGKGVRDRKRKRCSYC